MTTSAHSFYGFTAKLPSLFRNLEEEKAFYEEVLVSGATCKAILDNARRVLEDIAETRRLIAECNKQH